MFSYSYNYFKGNFPAIAVYLVKTISSSWNNFALAFICNLMKIGLLERDAPDRSHAGHRACRTGSS